MALAVCQEKTGNDVLLYSTYFSFTPQLLKQEYKYSAIQLTKPEISFDFM